MNKRVWIFLIVAIFLFVSFFVFPEFFSSAISYKKADQTVNTNQPKMNPVTAILPLDTALYDEKLNELANNPPDPIVYDTVKTIGKDKNGKSITITTKIPVSPQPIKTHLWPVKTVYPNAGALLPFNRIVAYYGNLYSTKMGVLGQYPEDQMLQMLEGEVKKWEIADPTTPVIPALQYIAVVAQGAPGDSGKYRLRMPDSEIDKV